NRRPRAADEPETEDKNPSGALPGQRDEAADDGAVGDVGGEAGERCLRAVVAHQEAGWLEQGDGGRGGGRRSHAWVDQREQDVDERGAGEEPVSEPERRPEPPAAVADRGEYRVVDERERDPGEEVQDVAERLGPCSVGREGGAEQEREIHPSQVELVSR